MLYAQLGIRRGPPKFRALCPVEHTIPPRAARRSTVLRSPLSRLMACSHRKALGTEDARNDIFEAWHRVVPPQVPRTDPAGLDVLPVQAHTPDGRVEQEWMDDVHRRLVPGQDRRPCEP